MVPVDASTVTSFSTTTSISAPPARVWAVLSQVTQWPGWTPTVESVTPVDGQRGDAPAVGRSYRVVQPKLRPATYTITSLEPGKAFTWEARQPGLRVIAGHRVEAEGDGSRVILTLAFEGWLAPLVWPLVRRIACDYLEQEARSLKARVESMGT